MISSEACIQKFHEEYSFRLAPITLQHYHHSVEKLIAFLEKPIIEITARDIRNWLSHLKANGYHPGTINNELIALKVFFRFCFEENYVTRNPVNSIPLPSLPDKLPRYLRVEQWKQLREIVGKKAEERAIVELLYATGVRLSELIDMKKEDIEWNERLIHIPKGKRKIGRIVCFSCECAEYLTAYLEKRKDDFPFLFVNPTGTGPARKRTIQTRFEKYGTQLGIPISPHTLRHTFAAHLAIKGMPLEGIQTFLGHVSYYQTQMYARLYNQARKEMYDKWM